MYNEAEKHLFFTQKNHARPLFVMLDTQYRMAEPIARLVSDFMYYGLVKSSEEVIARSQSPDYYSPDRLIKFPELAYKNIGIYTYAKSKNHQDKQQTVSQLPNVLSKLNGNHIVNMLLKCCSFLPLKFRILCRTTTAQRLPSP